MNEAGGPHFPVLLHPGLARAAQSVDDALADIRRMLSSSRLPRSAELLEVFSLSPIGIDRPLSFSEHIAEYVAARGEVGMPPAEVASYSLALGTLEDSLVDIHNAIRWSEGKSSLQWWIDRRLNELDIGDVLIVASPGSTRTFEVERESSLAGALKKLTSKIDFKEQVLDQASRFRILTVPYRDGADARWHPVSLGHELAHLRFTDEWVDSWLAGQTADPEPRSVSQVVRIAQGQREGTAVSTDHWYNETRDWLKETACDTALWHFYGEPGLRALRSYLDVHTAPGPSVTHPPPQMRLWIMGKDEPHPDAARLLTQSTRPLETSRMEAYQKFAPLVRDAVRAELQGVPLSADARDWVATQANSRRAEGEPPNSADWERETMLSSPSSIEAGLVASLWNTGPPALAPQAPSKDDDAYAPIDGEADGAAASSERSVKEAASWERRVQHAVDFLQFQHRFWSAVPGQPRDESLDDFDLTNTLHVSLTGVRTSRTGEGRPARDIRLGRHFIVFKRNAALSLNAIQGAESRRVQEMVEIGWGERFILHPHEMVLAVTLESILMDDDCNAQVLSRSSLGRMGLLSATAVHVQPGFRGCLTLELVNLASIPLEITPGQRIAQIVAAPICGQPRVYDGKYQDQDWLPRFSDASRDRELQTIGRLRERP